LVVLVTMLVVVWERTSDNREFSASMRDAI
jgi:hypothetical protein